MIRILVSNVSIPTSNIGSWTNRISKLILKEPDFFDYILAPTSEPNKKFIYCKKKNRIPLLPSRFKEWALRNYVAKDFCLAIKKICNSKSKLQVVVMDDLVLLEAMATIKHRLDYSSFELVYSFHGHSFSLNKYWSVHVDKVLFLTRRGYLETLINNESFTPLVSIVGNGTDTNLFYSLDKIEKEKRKIQLGYNVSDKVVIWMSNNRPKKGLHLFKQLAERLEKKYSDLHFLIIGTNQDYEYPSHQKWRSIGKISNDELPEYLQVGDFYFFTSLWKEGFGLSLIEAAKCGNIIIASANGGIPEVVEGLENAFLVPFPNIIESWEDAFEKAYEDQTTFQPNRKKLSEFHNLEEWESKFIKALQD